jgi:hypothetical protein
MKTLFSLLFIGILAFSCSDESNNLTNEFSTISKDVLKISDSIQYEIIEYKSRIDQLTISDSISPQVLKKLNQETSINMITLVKTNRDLQLKINRLHENGKITLAEYEILFNILSKSLTTGSSFLEVDELKTF